MQNKVRAVALISGGLDSLLATKAVMEQGIEVEGVNVVIGFGGKENPAQRVAELLGIKLHIIDVIDEFKDVLLQPRHGYGAHLNPCLDCKIFMVAKAKEWMLAHGFDFIVTGEVVGQRPKSQRNDTMPVVASESGAEELLLRPLCAGRLAPTLPERKGWIKREHLYSFSGRSRKPQFELVQKFGFQEFPQPAGGCLLTEKKFCDRLTALWQFKGEKNYSREELSLLKIGRHLQPRENFRMIVGRDHQENLVLAQHLSHYSSFSPISHNGPLVLLDGNLSDVDIKLAAAIAARFSAGRNAAKVVMRFNNLNGEEQELTVKPLAVELIAADWYV